MCITELVSQGSKPFDDGMASSKNLLEYLFCMLARCEGEFSRRQVVQFGQVHAVVVVNASFIQDMLAHGLK